MVKRNKNPGSVWEVSFVSHAVWDEMVPLLEEFSDEQMAKMKSSMEAFEKEREALIKQAIANEMKEKFPSFTKLVHRLVAEAKVFCVKNSPSLKLREYKRALY